MSEGHPRAIGKGASRALRIGDVSHVTIPKDPKTADRKRPSLAQGLQYSFVRHRDQGESDSHLLIRRNIIDAS